MELKSKTKMSTTIFSESRKPWKRHVGQTKYYSEENGISKTDQSFRSEVNVNSIMAKYHKTGQITHLARSAGVYADVSMVTDLAGAYQMVEAAEAAFATIPAKLREQIGNDPSRLAAWLQDPANRELGEEYGVFNKRTDESTPSSVKSAKPKSPPSKKVEEVTDSE